MLATVALFRIFGPRRTRLAAQVVSAIVGAGFVIALQVGAILSYGTMSRFAVLMSDHASTYAPSSTSILWWPARAVLGDNVALFALLALSLVLLGVAMTICAPLFGESIVSVAGGSVSTRSASVAKPFRARSPQQALRRKELMLLRRDPWLVSQTLMQLLYLVPPALMMWRSFGSGAGTALLLVPVIVMGAGQLAGGIAWLSISGEDAPDLIATTPLVPSAVMRAKIEVVLIAIAVVLTPLLIPMAIAAPMAALIAASGAAVAAIAATTIQYWFRAQARRSQFRRRHTSSRIATFAEAFSSIGWAAVSALVLMSPLVAGITAVMVLVVLALTYAHQLLGDATNSAGGDPAFRKREVRPRAFIVVGRDWNDDHVADIVSERLVSRRRRAHVRANNVQQGITCFTYDTLLLGAWCLALIGLPFSQSLKLSAMCRFEPELSGSRPINFEFTNESMIP